MLLPPFPIPSSPLCSPIIKFTCPFVLNEHAICFFESSTKSISYTKYIFKFFYNHQFDYPCNVIKAVINISYTNLLNSSLYISDSFPMSISTRYTSTSMSTSTSTSMSTSTFSQDTLLVAVTVPVVSITVLTVIIVAIIIITVKISSKKKSNLITTTNVVSTNPLYDSIGKAVTHKRQTNNAAENESSHSLSNSYALKKMKKNSAISSMASQLGNELYLSRILKMK